MTPTTFRSVSPFFLKKLTINRSAMFGMLIIVALLAFELFNYSTTDFALGDLLGGLKFMGIRWATILAIAFCGIDFAGIARLFTPEVGSQEPAEVWYLLGAWILAATMNALLTWWGVSLAILNHETLGNAVIARPTLIKIVPVFVAIMVWLIRVLIIGTFSVTGDRLLHGQRAIKDQRTNYQTNARPLSHQAYNQRPTPQPNYQNQSGYRPAPKPIPQNDMGYSRPEPTYSPVGMSARNQANSNQVRR